MGKLYKQCWRFFKSSASLIDITKDVWAFLKETYNLPLFICIIAITSLYVTSNEIFNIYEWIVKDHYTSVIKLIGFFILDFSAYILCCISIYLFTSQKAFLKQFSFWAVSVGIFFFIALFRASFLKHLLDPSSINIDLYHYGFRLINYLDSLLVVFVPLILFYIFYDKKYVGHFYGLSKKGVDFTPYIWMLMVMAVLVFIASGQSSFQVYYPEVKKSHYIQVAESYNVPTFVTMIIYEFFYMSAFVVVEVLYRGVLIFTMIRYLGKYALYPMMSVYCILHFGKPLNETISSFFGGFILGVLAIKGKNIYGGIAIHMGIALLMEVFVALRLA